MWERTNKLAWMCEMKKMLSGMWKRMRRQLVAIHVGDQFGMRM